MSQKQKRTVGGLAGVTLLGLIALAFFVPRQETVGHEDGPEDLAPAIRVAENSVELLVELGRKDEEQIVWEGSIEVSEGRVLDIDILRSARNATVEENRFRVRNQQVATKKKAKKNKKKNQPQVNLLSTQLRVRLDAPASATVQVKTSRGDFSFPLADVALGMPVQFLEGQVSVERRDASVLLTGPNTEDDHPVMARGKDGTVWLAYVEYKPAGQVIMEQVENRRFDSLEPKGNGDRIRLMRFDGKTWQHAGDVTEAGLDVWRPTISVDGKGNVVVAWAEKKGGDWDIFYRKLTPGEGGGEWAEVVQVSKEKGSDFNVVSTTDAEGRVWLAWQAWRDDEFQLLVKPLDHQKLVQHTGGIANANDWCPSITADSNGKVYVAWDHYSEDSYNLSLLAIEPDKGDNFDFATKTNVSSPRFEARPHIVCDSQDRLWLAYEEGDVNWGEDYQGNTPEKVGLKNLGQGLYVNRTIRVKCLVDGKWMEPSGDLQKAFGPNLQRNKSVPRLCVDEEGGVWLCFRHHPLSGGGGEVWQSYAMRYDGNEWSPPRELPNSLNILDNKPALLPYEQGLLAVYSGDKRQRTQNRDQDDLYAAAFNPDGETSPPKLKPATEREIADVEPVHPNEAEAIGRMRDFRLEIGGKTLRPIRGEFHRHTEYTAHRDQDGLLEDAWRYALDVGKLDWMGDGDHDNGFGHEYMWWQIQKISDLYHNPPHFVAAITYERSVVYPSGHRNVMFPRRGIRPLPRLSNQQPILFGTEEEGSPDIKLLYDYLKHFEGICSIHTSGTNMGTDWRDNDPEVEPVVEIYQGHRHSYEHFGAPRSATEDTQIGGYRPAGFVWHALEKGYRLGFQSSSDHVSTHMSYGVAWVEEPSRQQIIDAFKRRHSYGATDNILLVVRSGEHLMGEEFETSKPPSFDIHVHGATKIAKVHVVRDNKYVFTKEPNEQVVNLKYTDADAKPGSTAYYYVRVEQTDGNVAWGSPMWVTYKP